MVTIAFILLHLFYVDLLEVRAVVFPQDFADTAGKVMFMFWLWPVQVSCTNKSFYHQGLTQRQNSSLCHGLALPA